MTDKTDAQIARQWAEKVKGGATPQVPIVSIAKCEAIARHILATATPLTMADVEWENDVHAGLCAVYTAEDVTVRMIARNLMYTDYIECCWLRDGNIRQAKLPRKHLTPLPGTRLDLTPRRHDGGWEA